MPLSKEPDLVHRGSTATAYSLLPELAPGTPFPLQGRPRNPFQRLVRPATETFFTASWRGVNFDIAALPKVQSATYRSIDTSDASCAC
jgi:hypothetical protein